MEPSEQPQLTERDIQFECSHCQNVLVVDRDGEGLELDCPHCSARVRVPPYMGDPRLLAAAAPKPPTPPPAAAPSVVPTVPPAPAATAAPPATGPAEPPPRRREFDFHGVSEELVRKREAELRHLLKENQSQRVEIQGYINQATITLHRNQLKLRKLIERQVDFEAEMTAILRRLGPSPSGAQPAGTTGQSS